MSEKAEISSEISSQLSLKWKVDCYKDIVLKAWSDNRNISKYICHKTAIFKWFMTMNIFFKQLFKSSHSCYSHFLNKNEATLDFVTQCKVWYRNVNRMDNQENENTDQIWNQFLYFPYINEECCAADTLNASTNLTGSCTRSPF